MKRLALTAGLLPLLALASVQAKTVTGEVYTLGDLPCPNVRVAAARSGDVTLTDSLGRFSVQCADKDRLRFTGEPFAGRTEKIPAGDTRPLRVEMKFPYTPQNVELAVGYGRIRESDRTSAVEKLEQYNGFCQYHDIYDVFRGRFAGVTVVGTDIVIRGICSVNASSAALVLVDGVPVSGNLSFISPCDIEDISIIKDGSASIYGMRGANGVVLISLKKRN